MNEVDVTLDQVKASEFALIEKETRWHDDLYLFLQNVFHLFPEDKFQELIVAAVKLHSSDQDIYQDLETKLAGIKPFLQNFTYALPALKTQKEEMTRQTLTLLGSQRNIDGYFEIGSPGRYISHLRHSIQCSGEIVLMNDLAPGYGAGDIFERGGIRKIGRFIALNNYRAIASDALKDQSMDLVTCFIGLHHAPLALLRGFVGSIVRTIRPGGRFILRDHDAGDPDMRTFASLIHTVFNLGLGVSWDTNKKEIRNFRSCQFWIDLLAEFGMIADSQMLLQKNDPSLNTLIMFTKK